MGSQWFWSYYQSGYGYDSFMIAESDLHKGDLRQLAVDNYLVFREACLVPDRNYTLCPCAA